VDQDELVMLIRVLYEKQSGKRLWPAQWNNIAAKLHKIMPGVLSKCAQSGWDPALFVRAQIESMGAIYKKGGTLTPGSFYGLNAEGRFSRWVDRRRHAHGTARHDRTEETAARAERFTAATMVYGYSLCIGGASIKTATSDAVSMWPLWTLDKVTAADRLRALQHVLSSINSSFPHRILLPEDETVPEWEDMVTLSNMLRSTPIGETIQLDDTLGEML
jgi:hypothetical protein